jgi:hypothetical protein
MAKEETDITHTIMIDTSKLGARMFKNVRGLFYTKGEVMNLLAAIKTGRVDTIMAAVRKLRQVMAGLQAEDSSDLIGFRPTVITQDMVGTTVAIFSAIEVKTVTGAVRDGQHRWIDFVLKNGGFAGVARSPDEAKEILKYPID